MTNVPSPSPGLVELLAQLEAAGVRLRLAPGGKLVVAGVPLELLPRLREHRVEIQELLRAEATSAENQVRETRT